MFRVFRKFMFLALVLALTLFLMPQPANCCKLCTVTGTIDAVHISGSIIPEASLCVVHDMESIIARTICLNSPRGITNQTTISRFVVFGTDNETLPKKEKAILAERQSHNDNIKQYSRITKGDNGFRLCTRTLRLG